MKKPRNHLWVIEVTTEEGSYLHDATHETKKEATRVLDYYNRTRRDTPVKYRIVKFVRAK